MPATTTTSSVGNDYTFGSDAPTSRKKKKNKKSAAADIQISVNSKKDRERDSKDQTVSTDDDAPAPDVQTDHAPVINKPTPSTATTTELHPSDIDPPKDNSNDGTSHPSDVDPPENNSIDATSAHAAPPAVLADVERESASVNSDALPSHVADQDSSSPRPDLLEIQTAARLAVQLEPDQSVSDGLLADAPARLTAVKPTLTTLPLSPTLPPATHADAVFAPPTPKTLPKLTPSLMVNSDSKRRSLDPSPDRRHPSLQPSSPRPSPVMLPVRPHDPPVPSHVAQLPGSRTRDWRYNPSERPPAFICAVQLDSFSLAIASTGRFIINNIALVGNSGGLDVCRLNRQRETVGRLEGLRGAVIEARIIPPPLARQDPLHSLRPLVACVVHGPASHHASLESSIEVSSYQTSVEVYSLRSTCHVQTLYSSPPIPLDHPITHQSHAATPPAPEFHISLAANARFLTVALGNSGEVFVFDLTDPMSDDTSHSFFYCVGKFWTVCRPRPLPPRADKPSSPRVPDYLPDIPLFSLSGRWLAVVPPLLSSSQKSADGSLPSGTITDESVSVFVCPPPPQADCDVDAPADGGVLNRVTKQATHEVVKGAQWVGEQGLGMFKSYWRRTSQPTSDDQAHVAVQAYPRTGQSSEDFPPTHGHVRHEPAVQPALVSIIDLHQYLENSKESGPTCLATFALNDGCSFLSFDPSGLSLLTSNQLGDAVSIWDLSRITDMTLCGRQTDNTTVPSHTTKTISRIAHYPRLSPSSVVDVQWTAQGRRVGILTQKGTVHLHEVQRNDDNSSRRASSLETNLHQLSGPSASTGHGGSSPQSPTNGWVSNVVSGWQTVQKTLHDPEESFVDSTRKRLGEAGVLARNAGNRAVRNGYSTAVNGAQSLRHAQKNKIRLRAALGGPVRPGCFRWLSGKAEGVVAVIDDGVLATYAIKSHYYHQNRHRVVVALDAGRKVGGEQVLIDLGASAGTGAGAVTGAGNRLPPSLLGILDPKGPYGACASAGVHGFWTLGHGTDKMHQPSMHRTANSVPNAAAVVYDKETCPQQMPFHRHRHVDMMTYDEDDVAVRLTLLGLRKRPTGSIDHAGVDDADGFVDKPWVFGLDLPSTTRVNVASVRSSPATDAEPEPDMAIGPGLET